MENKQAGVSSTSTGNYPYSREHQNLQNEFTRAYITRPLEPSDVDVNTARYSPRSQFAQYPRAYNQHNKNILRQQFYQNVHPHYSNKQEIYDQKATTSYADNIYQNSLKQSDDSIKKVNVETKPVLDSSESQYEILLHRHQKKLQNASATSESSSVAGTNQSFQSPLVKRKPDAPITLQGWLHKQGSDGLHLWRRRWFVLSEYCLFYYKSQEEHKLLGSILLPSYKVSICGSEDKVYRKFSFKLEHLNMRTYILAASSQNSMVQWLRAVSMACVASIPAVPSKTNYPIDQKPAHQVRSAQPETTSVPVKETWSGSPRQPLYANAPPKPKRLFDDIDWNAVSAYHGTSQVISDPRLYYSNCEQLTIHNTERRTPDTYGRSNQFKPYSDYEVLQGSKMYKPPFSPEMFYKRMYSKDSINLWQPSNVTMRNNAYTLPDYNRPNAHETRVIRPRSADFLDYHENDIDNDTRYLERPKSSLDIITKNDSYFCSEESYAEKIRQSALYLQQKSIKQVPFKKAAIDQFNLPIESNYIDTINSNEIENKKITGDKKREESMMRLLEWKQRMLQSPLRRNSRGFPEHSLRRHQQYLHPRDRFRRNSFSSDDEDAKGTSQTGGTTDKNDTESLDRSFTIEKPVEKQTVNMKPTTGDDNTSSDKWFKNVEGLESPIERQQQSKTYEEHYMAMTPKKSVFEPSVSSSSTIAEESSYVEMTQTFGNSLLSSENQAGDKKLTETQPYETMCIKGGRMEPVYIDLNRETNDIHKNIDLQSQKNKSDGSDADDEASKGLDSLDPPSFSRFNLFDTFRPASYFLGASHVLELQDSSDSELVSPPPILASSSLLEDSTQQKEDGEISGQNQRLYFQSLGREYNKSNTSLKTLTGSHDEYSISKQNIEKVLEMNDTVSVVEQDDDTTLSSKQLSYSDGCSNNDSISNFSSNLNAYFLEPSQKKYQSEGNLKDHFYENTCLISQSRTREPCVVYRAPHDRSAHITTLDKIVPKATMDSESSKHADVVYLKKGRNYHGSDGSTSPSGCSGLSTETCMNNQNAKIDIRHKNDSYHFLSETQTSSDDLDCVKSFKITDEKNIYNSSLDREKYIKSAIGILDSSTNLSEHESIVDSVRKCHSLESLLSEGLLAKGTDTNDMLDSVNINLAPSESIVDFSDGNHLWDKDCLWKENLRRISQRHARSLDDLENGSVCKSSYKEHINKNLCEEEKEFNFQDNSQSNNDTWSNNSSGQNTSYNFRMTSGKESVKKSSIQKKENTFVVDREKLRQWDLMSSAPVLLNKTQSNNGYEKDGIDNGQINTKVAIEPASGSMSMSSLRSLQPSTPWLMSQSENSTKAYHQNQLMCAHETDSRSSTPQNFMINDHKKEVHLIDNNDVTNSQYYKDIQQTISSNVPNVWKLSAGELLGRTYEELVLLLIQLRRQNVNDFQAIECCYSEINSLQLMFSLKDTVHKLDDLLRLDQLKRHLVQLKKQYEKSKPLLNLVENMVKLGSLYRQGRHPNRSGQEIPQAELMAFNRIMQERWVKAEEERDWYRVNPNHSLLNKFQDTLTDNNDSYEQDSYMVYQKSPHLQKSMGNSSNIIPKVCEPDPRRNSVTLECELKRVQDLVGDLNRQRQELNRQVSHLIGKSQNLIQQIQTPTTQDSSTSKKTSQSSWLETDLDYSAGEDKQMTITSDYSSLNSNTLYHSTPLTNISDDSTINSSDTELQSLYCPLQEKQGIKTVRIVKRESERRQRDREKLCSAGTSIASSTPLTECQWDVLETEDMNISKDESLICDTSDYTTIDNSITNKSYASSKYSPISTKSVQFETKLKSASPEYSNNRYSESEPQSTLVLEKFKSETAQKIINELTDYNKKQTVSRRTVPKEKRRHYTAPHQSIATSTSRLEDIHVLNKEIDRAKDDLDMERALRSRFNPPDVVRSTLSHRELRYNEGVIDSVLGTPNKIVIPERYIPEQSPQLSAEEQQRRLQKVESIKKMLSDSTSVVTTFSLDSTNNKQPSASISEEKKQREHLLQLNQILAKQVIEMSKIITEKALLTLPLTQAQQNYEEEDLSPMTPLPLYQQRENYYS